LQRECPRSTFWQKAKYSWFYLYLKEALTRYREKFYAHQGASGTFLGHVCQAKLTTSTQFQLLFDASAGANVLNALPIVLPISGLNVDASPDYTHYLQIGFTLRQDMNGTDACAAIQPKNPPPKSG
jgi:hypothetical protein